MLILNLPIPLNIRTLIRFYKHNRLIRLKRNKSLKTSSLKRYKGYQQILINHIMIKNNKNSILMLKQVIKNLNLLN